MSKHILFLLFLLLLGTIPTGSAAVNFVGGVVEFDSEADLPTLLTAVGNTSQLSEAGGVYTMHVPFYQKSAVDGFIIDTTLHLKSLGDGNEADFRWKNTTITGATILGWNTTSGAVAQYVAGVDPVTMYSDIGAKGQIINSNISYLKRVSVYSYGSDIIGNTFIETVLYCESHTDLSINDNIFTDSVTGCLDGDFNNVTVNNNSMSAASDNVGMSGLYTGSVISNNTIPNGALYGIMESSIFRDNVVSRINGYTYCIFFVSGDSSSCYNNVLSICPAGYYTSRISNFDFYNETIIDASVGFDMRGDTHTITFTECNTSLCAYAYGFTNVDASTTIIDNVNRSDVIYSDVTFDTEFTGAEYNTTYYITSASILKDNPLSAGEILNISVTHGGVTPSLIKGVTPSQKYVLLYSNGTFIESITSDASGNATFTTVLGVGDYYAVTGDDNFSWSGASANPSNILTTDTSQVSVTVTDTDGTITKVYARIFGINYSMSNTVGNTWTRTYTPLSEGVKPVLFYAQDNHMYWGFYNPAISITVTVPEPTPDPGMPSPPPVCDGVTCTPHCTGTTYNYNGRCIDGVCVYDTQDNHDNCLPNVSTECIPFCMDGLYYFDGVLTDGTCVFETRIDLEMCPTIPCAGVICTAHCEGTTYYHNGTCIDDICVYEITENHPNCPIDEPSVDVWGVIFNLFLLLIALILFVVAYNEMLSDK